MKYCPYCQSKLRYKDIVATAYVIRERWYCSACREIIVFDKPGLFRQSEQQVKAEHPESKR